MAAERSERQELEHLRDQVEALQERLTEEAAWYRSQLEAQRRRHENEATREHSREVARRRRAEAELAQARNEIQALRRRVKQGGGEAPTESEEAIPGAAEEIQRLQEEGRRLQQHLERAAKALRRERDLRRRLEQRADAPERREGITVEAIGDAVHAHFSPVRHYDRWLRARQAAAVAAAARQAGQGDTPLRAVTETTEIDDAHNPSFDDIEIDEAFLQSPGDQSIYRDE